MPSSVLTEHAHKLHSIWRLGPLAVCCHAKCGFLCHPVTSYCCWILSFFVDSTVTACFTSTFSQLSAWYWMTVSTAVLVLYGKKGIYKLTVFFWFKLLEKYYLLLVSKLLFLGSDISRYWTGLGSFARRSKKSAKLKFAKSSVLQRCTLFSLWVINYLLAVFIFRVLVGTLRWLPSPYCWLMVSFCVHPQLCEPWL